jgi:hypothetical protein
LPEAYRKLVVTRLLACPFCRELFDRAETERCPECDIPLAPLHRLGPSYEAVDHDAVRWERPRVEDEVRAFFDLGRGRGALLAIAALSLALFALAPWVSITSPHTALRSGLSLARGPLGFLWGGATAWLVSLALVASRRTIRQMRGVRVILMLFAAMTASEILMLMVMSPSPPRAVPVAYEWCWGLYAALAASVLGVIAAARFGGAAALEPSLEPIEAASPAACEGSSESAETVH